MQELLKDLTNPFTLDVLADGMVVYGKEVLDKEVFKRYHIQPILNLPIKIFTNWRNTDELII